MKQDELLIRIILIFLSILLLAYAIIIGNLIMLPHEQKAVNGGELFRSTFTADLFNK